ncbi:MAG: ribokinase [Eubacteriales bacterium]|nr:ribokinase [Eubacteriales bacterium]
MKILNFGSLNIDYVYSVDHIVRGGETILSTKSETFCGGKGLNQSIALARAGIQVYHAGLIGREGQLLLETCARYGVDTTYIRELPEKGGHTMIQVDSDGQNSIILYGGTNQMQTREYIDEVLSHFESDDFLILQNEINLLHYIIDKAYERGMKIVLNPSPFDNKLKACDLSKIYLFMLNEIEGEQFTGFSDAEEILESLAGKFPEAKFVLTLGSNGSVYYDGKVKLYQGIFPVDAVDTTAAGDTFTGFFMASVIAGKSVEEALCTASKASSIAVSRPGASVSIPSASEVSESLQEQRRLKITSW